MPRRAMIIAAVVGTALIALLVAGAYLNGYSDEVDTAHWVGWPLPPCFVDGAECGGHWLGTDEVGRDLLARLIAGARFTLGVSFLAAVAELLVAGVAAVLYRRGSVTRYIIERCVDAVSSFPVWPFIIVIAAILDANHATAWKWRLTVIVLVASILMSARLIRKLREATSISAILSAMTYEWAAMILLLATIDFFGFGVQPPFASWGNMLVGFQQNFQVAWWAAVFPAVFIFLAVLLIELGRRVAFSASDA